MHMQTQDSLAIVTPPCPGSAVRFDPLGLVDILSITKAQSGLLVNSERFVLY